MVKRILVLSLVTLTLSSLAACGEDNASLADTAIAPTCVSLLVCVPNGGMDCCVPLADWKTTCGLCVWDYTTNICVTGDTSWYAITEAETLIGQSASTTQCKISM